MISKIRQILEITKEEDLKKEFGDFEDQVDLSFHSLRTNLAKDIRSTEVTSLLDHMTDVERYRERLVKALSLAEAFSSHCKSDAFTVPKGKGVTDFDRTAYQKRLTAGFIGMVVYLEGAIYSLDSRVNLCKKLLGIEDNGFTNKIK